MPYGTVIRPGPGDIVVWRVDRDYPEGKLAEVARQVQEMFPHNQVIVTNDASVDVWTDEDLLALGLQRIPR